MIAGDAAACEGGVGCLHGSACEAQIAPSSRECLLVNFSGYIRQKPRRRNYSPDANIRFCRRGFLMILCALRFAARCLWAQW